MARKRYTDLVEMARDITGDDQLADELAQQIKEREAIEFAVEKLKKLQADTDQEVAHVEADNTLCDLLVKLGAKDVVSEFNKIDKWYA